MRSDVELSRLIMRIRNGAYEVGKQGGPNNAIIGNTVAAISAALELIKDELRKLNGVQMREPDVED